ncbi:MAG: DUF4313 domain-containing protein [Clostridium sp.]|nr:DUF4313 domain-containing protein [Clostridium sp.]
METKSVIIEGKEIELLRYRDKWVFPMFGVYEGRLGSPVALELYSLENNTFEYYSCVTVHLEGRSAGCQFIDTNNHFEDILKWLEDNKFGELTGKKVNSGFCSYPELNFYKGENFWKYREISNALKEDLEGQRVREKKLPSSNKREKLKRKTPANYNKRER